MDQKTRFPGDREKAKSAIVQILRYLGEDETREGLRDTPSRVLRSWDQIFQGRLQNPKDVFKTFQEDDVVPKDQIILLKNIEFYSTCEHHMLPFTGMAHIAYIPHEKVAGVSKLARVLEIYARRLQIQERIGNQVTQCLMNHLDPKGSACVIESTHFCMTCRGVQKQQSKMVTSSLRGCFLENGRTRVELMSLIRS